MARHAQPKPKKTFKVDDFKAYVNDQLTRTDEFALSNENFKGGLCNALEHILHRSNSYKGFNNLYWMEGGCAEWEANGKVETWPEKDKYILGEKGSKYNGDRYARKYY